MKKIVFVVLMTIICISYAEDIAFTCSGIMTSTAKGKVSNFDSGRFDVALDPTTGQIWGFPNFMAWGCVNDEILKIKKNTFKITPISAIRECANNEATSTLRMSRNTGDLNIMTTHNWSKYTEIQEGTYSCQKISNRVF